MQSPRLPWGSIPHSFAQLPRHPYTHPCLAPFAKESGTVALCHTALWVVGETYSKRKRLGIDMNKKQSDIADRLNDCLDLMVFDQLITSEERQEMSRKLGVLFDLPDLLAFFDLRDIAIVCLADAVPISTAAAIESVIRKQEGPAKNTQHTERTTHTETEPASTHGENDEAANTSGEAWIKAPAGPDC